MQTIPRRLLSIGVASAAKAGTLIESNITIDSIMLIAFFIIKLLSLCVYALW